jgi:hypothetical protein
MKRHHHDDDIFTIVNGKKVVKDGKRIRVATTFMDGAIRKQVAHFGRVTDATGSDMGLHQPGFRLNSRVSAADRNKIYDRYDQQKQNEWRTPLRCVPDRLDGGHVDENEEERLCPRCGGSGLAENGSDDCPACEGSGAVPIDHDEQELGTSDRRSVDQMVRDHRQRMSSEYARYDQSLRESWRR